jgi:hypothetical protein
MVWAGRSERQASETRAVSVGFGYRSVAGDGRSAGWRSPGCGWGTGRGQRLAPAGSGPDAIVSGRVGGWPRSDLSGRVGGWPRSDRQWPGGRLAARSSGAAGRRPRGGGLAPEPHVLQAADERTRPRRSAALCIALRAKRRWNGRFGARVVRSAPGRNTSCSMQDEDGQSGGYARRTGRARTLEGPSRTRARFGPFGQRLEPARVPADG